MGDISHVYQEYAIYVTSIFLNILNKKISKSANISLAGSSYIHPTEDCFWVFYEILRAFGQLVRNICSRSFSCWSPLKFPGMNVRIHWGWMYVVQEGLLLVGKSFVRTRSSENHA